MLIGCSAAGNDAGGDGGGSHDGGGGDTMTLANCTVYGNFADGSGGGIESWGTVTLVSCTVTANHAVNHDTPVDVGGYGIGGGVDVLTYITGTLVMADCIAVGN